MESRQDELDLGDLADGPMEMLYSNLTARSLGIEVKGIDWWSLKTNKPRATSSKRDDNIEDEEQMDYLDFIARVTSHIPDKGQVMVRYFG